MIKPNSKIYGIVSEQELAPLIFTAFEACQFPVVAPVICNDAHIGTIVGAMRVNAFAGLYGFGLHVNSFSQLADNLLDSAGKTLYADTLARSDSGEIVGYDSMYDAFESILMPKLMGISNCKSVVLGTGHAGVSALAVLAPASIEVTVGSRLPSPYYHGLLEMERVTENLNCVLNITDTVAANVANSNIIVNTTPIPFNILYPDYVPHEGQFILDLASDTETDHQRGWPTFVSYLLSFAILRWSGCPAAKHSDNISTIYELATGKKL